MAAYASDICLHTSLAASTAAIECAAVNKPTYIIDYDGYPFNRLFDKNKNHILYKKVEDFVNSLDDNFNKIKQNENIENWSEIINQIDNFKDGRAAERIGNYLNDLMFELNKGESKNNSLEIAKNNYINQWGTANVTQTY